MRKDEDVRYFDMDECYESYTPFHHVNYTTHREYINELGRNEEVHQFHVEQPPQTDSDDYVHEALPLLFEFITFIL